MTHIRPGILIAEGNRAAVLVVILRADDRPRDRKEHAG